LIDVAHNAVQRRVTADAQFGARDVVVDCHRQTGDRNVEGGVLLPVAVQFVSGMVAVPAAGHQQTVDPVSGNLFGNPRDSSAAGHIPVGADLGTPFGHPPTDVHPVHFPDVTRAQSAESV